MQCHLLEGGALKTLDALPSEPVKRGCLWVDFVRENEAPWAEIIKRFGGVNIATEHISDSLNASHPPVHDGSEAYDILIARELLFSKEHWQFETVPFTVFITPTVLVTVRDARGRCSDEVLGRCRKGNLRIPQRAAGLAHRLMSSVVDEYMALRNPLSERLIDWQAQLLDPRNPFDDWQELMEGRGRLRVLQSLCEQHQDLLASWHEDPAVGIDDDLSIRLRDVAEHSRRVHDQLRHTQAEIESLVQLHFAANTHRTNEIMKVLTVLTAIFMPLTLVTSIFGMNFDDMPELRRPGAYHITLLAMVVLALGLLAWFRRKRWF